MGFLRRSPNINPSDFGNNVKDDSSDHITYFQSSDFQVVWSSHHLFRLLAFFSVIRSWVIEALCWICDALFGQFCGNRIFKINTEFCCHLCCNSSMSLDAIFFNVRRSLSLSVCFRPLFLLADDVFAWFLYDVITLETAAVDTTNKVAVLITDGPAKRAATICPLKFWQASHSAVLTYEL